MRNKFWILVALQFVLITFSGCAMYDFFDVRSAMAPPQSSKDEVAVENAICNYFNSDFKFCRLFIDERCSSVLKFNFSGAECIVVFCQTEDPELQSHIVLLEKSASDWVIRDEVLENNVQFGRAHVAYVNRGDICEVIAEGIDLRMDLPIAFSYQVEKDKIIKIER